MNGQDKTRFDAEIEEFTEKFPDGDLDAVPEYVWQKVKEGRKLAEAYSEYESEKKAEADEAKLVNELNASNSSGNLGTKPAKAVYTAKEVASMSADAIRENYDDIIESMKAKGFYA